MGTINTSNVSVDSTGRVQFSGLTSNIDSKGAIDAIVKAKSIPIDTLKTKVTAGEKKITALQELRTNLNGLKDALSKLYGAVSADSSSDIFEGKQTFASSSRTDGFTGSSPTNLIGVSVTNAAAVGSHTIEVLQTAASHKVGSSILSAVNTDLGTALGLGAGTVTGSFTIAGKSIAVSAADTLNDLADRINNANRGTSATGVSASIVSASATEKHLVLTVDATGKTLGTDVALTDPDAILEKLGLRSSGGAFPNELQAARKAHLHADGLVDPKSWTSADLASQSAAFGTAGTLTFTDGSGNTIGTLAYGAGDTLQTLRDAINGDGTLSGAGITAAIATDGSTYTLNIGGTGAVGIADSGTLVADLGLTKDPLLIERDSNTVSDLFKGVTLNLYQAEEGTTIKIDVDRDLSAVKTAIQGFASAYNTIRQFTNYHLDVDASTGKAREDAVLNGNRVVSEVETQFNQIFGTGAQGTDTAFSVLAQVGVKFVDNSTVDDPTLANTLEVDSAKLDQVLLNNVDDVKKLFTFSFSSSDPRFSLLSFSGATQYNSGGYQIGVTHDGAALTGATISDGGTATVAGQIIDITAGGATGLKLYFNGTSSVPSTQIDVTVGIGTQMFFALDKMLDQTSGSVETAITAETDSNTLATKRIDEMQLRVDMLRTRLTLQFLSMEQSLATLGNLKDSISQITDSWYQKND